MPRAAGPRTRAVVGVLRRLVLLAGLALALRYAWIHETQDPVRTAGDPPQELTIRAGQSAESIGADLHALGLVRHPALFRALVFARGDGARLKAGEYVFDDTLSLDGIVDRLVRGETARIDVTFPEGKTLEEMADLAAARGVDRAAFRRAALDPGPMRDLDPDARNLEGYLFPDTYDVTRRPDARRLVMRMVERFRDVVEPMRTRLEGRGLTLRQLVTLASIVELETGRPEERGRIAAVFLNRLAKGMLLQTDPTVIYALRLKGTWDGNIRKEDLQMDSPYNTYRNAGLPPGPIASPGREALHAVIEPADTRALYFVSRNDGTHEFSDTLAEHERAVTRFQRRRSGRS
ncbi:MAG TPA: endolytic transglycosylase MltG [Vicinamibacteria bacterium]|nr:endolytic transglycosylase MltG [Vicinamibacteria bacterium]